MIKKKSKNVLNVIKLTAEDALTSIKKVVVYNPFLDVVQNAKYKYIKMKVVISLDVNLKYVKDKHISVVFVSDYY